MEKLRSSPLTEHYINRQYEITKERSILERSFSLELFKRQIKDFCQIFSKSDRIIDKEKTPNALAGSGSSSRRRMYTFNIRDKSTLLGVFPIDKKLIFL